MTPHPCRSTPVLGTSTRDAVAGISLESAADIVILTHALPGSDGARLAA